MPKHHHDERNLSRLGLILPRENCTKQKWERTVQIDFLEHIHVSCLAGVGSVVPHGGDNDVLAGLINGFIHLGMPEHGEASCTVKQFLTYCGLEDNGQRREMLTRSLKRLQSTTYVLNSSWYDDTRQRWRTEQLSLLSYFSLEGETELDELVGQVQTGTVLQFQLPPLLVRSIRAGYTRALDVDVYRALDGILARNIYRTCMEMVQAQGRHDLSLPLESWAAYLGMEEMRRNNFVRALNTAHSSLLKAGVLQDVDYQGRSKTASVRYIVSHKIEQPIHSELVALLGQRGVKVGPAQQLARSHSAEHLRAAAVAFDRMNVVPGVQVRNPGAMMTDMIRNPEKYSEYFQAAEPPRLPAPAARPQPEAQEPEAEREAHTAQFLLKKMDLSPELLATLTTMYLERVVNATDLAKLGSMGRQEIREFIAQRSAQA